MREENKQTEEQKTSNRAVCYLLKLFNSTRKILSNKNTIKIFTILICIGYFLAFTSKAAAAIDIDNMMPNEIINIKRNGLISALCFTQDLLTGNVARAVGALFILGSGWLFIIGYIKDWLPVLSFTIAITLIFGGAEFAKVISGNDITCKTLYGIKEVNEETIYNDGICKIVDINLYSRGQLWYLCNNNEGFDINRCSEVTGETIISTEDQSVFLVACQTGSSKENEKVLLQYRCNPEKGAFEIVNKDKLEEGKCKTSCTFDQLKNIVKFYHAKNTTGGESDNSKATSFRILDESGELKLGKYFTVGTIIDLDCLSGYTEVEYSTEDEGNTQIEQNKPNNSALKATCTTTSSGAEFKVSGRCRTSCNLNNLSDNAREGFVKWEKYNEQTSLWEDTTAETFYFGDRVRIKTCNTDKGYSFDIGNDLTKQNPNDVKDSEKLIIKCGTNSSNEETWISENGGKGCVKLCDITKNDFYNEHVWAKDCPTVEDCRVELQTGEKFFRPGEKVGIIECRDTDNYYLNREENPGVGPLKLTCNYGEWKTDSGIICQKKCKLNTIPFYEYAKTWNVCRNKINLDDENPPCYELALEEIENLVEGHTVQHAICGDEKGFKDTNADSLSNATDRKSIFTCNKEGEFIRDSEVTDNKVGVCSPQCFPKLLGKFDIDSAIWYESDESGNKINSGDEVVLETYNAEKISDPNKYFTLDKCDIGYELINENNGNSDKTIIKCNDERAFESHKTGSKCTIIKCTFNKETIKNNLRLKKDSIDNYDDLGIEYSNSWIVVESDDKKETPIVGSTYSLNNSTSRFGYGTKLKMASCETGSLLFGNSDTVLKCNALGNWELTTESTKDSKIRRCKVGICRGDPMLAVGSYKPLGTRFYPNTGNIQNTGLFYDIDYNILTTAHSNINNDMYVANNSILNADCEDGYEEVKFNPNPTLNKSKSDYVCSFDDNCGGKRDSWSHYYYCDNSKWKVAGSCLKGCNHKTISNSNNNDQVLETNNKEGTYYDSVGNKKNIETDSFDVADTFATEGSVVDANCNAGFYKVSTGGNTTTAHNWKHAYICQSNEWKSIGSCKKGCKVSDIRLNSDIEQYLYNSANNISNTIINSSSGDNNGLFFENNSYVEVGTVLNVGCKNNYTAVGFGGEINTNYVSRWTHYYVCEEGGVWKSYGSCFTGCTSAPTADASENISFANAVFSGSVYNKTDGNLATFDKNNMNNVYYGNNSTVTGGCKSGYLEVDNNGNPDNNAIVYTCNNGSWSKNSGRCEKMCIGRPTLDVGSSYCGYEGAFYDANMNVTTAANSSSYAKHGAIFDVNCGEGYQEIYLIASAYNSSNGNKPGWGHYYYCNNGNWAYVGRCLAKGSKTFNYTGGSQTFTAPISSNEQVTLTLEVWGAQGGGSGGKGGYSEGKYNYTGGSISVWVGGQGGNPNGGYNGGGNGGDCCGGSCGKGHGGGGRSNIDLNGTPLIIAGGGGGGTESGKNNGGAGGGNGNNGNDGSGKYKGYGGTNSAGGASNDTCASNGAGKYGSGGNGCSGSKSGKYCPGGGGGGYYGGGAGDYGNKGDEGGGGGGSGRCTISNCSGSNGVREGNGYAKISW